MSKASVKRFPSRPVAVIVSPLAWLPSSLEYGNRSKSVPQQTVSSSASAPSLDHSSDCSSASAPLFALLGHRNARATFSRIATRLQNDPPRESQRCTPLYNSIASNYLNRRSDEHLRKTMFLRLPKWESLSGLEGEMMQWGIQEGT